jgi:hypothetical protein
LVFPDRNELFHVDVEEITCEPNDVFLVKKPLDTSQVVTAAQQLEFIARTAYLQENANASTMNLPPQKEGPMQSKGTTANDFARLPMLSVEQILIESKCLYCGNRIVSSVFEGLDDLEAEHRIGCPKPAKKK